MRRHVFAAMLIIAGAFLEASLLPFALGGLPRPNLILIFTAAWAALRGNEGFGWALGGGLMLDVLSSTPFGTHTAGLIFGNVLALLVDRLPLPAEFFRVTNWVAVTTLVYHATVLAVLAIAGRPYDLTLSVTGTILPLLAINPVLSLIAYSALFPIERRLNEQERFAR
jgi:rod shape-determining protein MreD